MKQLLASLPFICSLGGCATVGQTIPEDAVPLSTEEIAATFSGVTEKYKGRDNPGVSAVGKFREGGEFSASWSAGNQSGNVEGEWYAEDGKRCLNTVSSETGTTDVECHSIYKSGDVYMSMNDDGSIHGIHALTPME